MSDVIIAGLLMCGIAGLPIGLLIAVGRDHWWSKLIAIIICCAIFFGVGCMCGQESINDRNEFNNGVCVKCGGEDFAERFSIKFTNNMLRSKNNV